MMKEKVEDRKRENRKRQKERKQQQSKKYFIWKRLKKFFKYIF